MAEDNRSINAAIRATLHGASLHIGQGDPNAAINENIRGASLTGSQIPADELGADEEATLAALTAERDAARAEIEDIKYKQTLRELGVREDDLDYVQFKVGRLSGSGKDFKTEAEAFLASNQRFRNGSRYRVHGITPQPENAEQLTGDPIRDYMKITSKGKQEALIAALKLKP